MFHRSSCAEHPGLSQAEKPNREIKRGVTSYRDAPFLFPPAIFARRATSTTARNPYFLARPLAVGQSGSKLAARAQGRAVCSRRNRNQIPASRKIRARESSPP